MRQKSEIINMVNGCEECIVYQVQKGIVKPDLCQNCGKQEMSWRQSEGGTLYLECSYCHDAIAVDLNTPCEVDPVFAHKIKMTIEPQQKMPEKEAVAGLAKVSKVNALGMRKMLIDGTSMECVLNELEAMTSLMDRFGVSYSLENYVDCKLKYQFYKECRYPYSAMKKLCQ